jgi:hypothetical protein
VKQRRIRANSIQPNQELAQKGGESTGLKPQVYLRYFVPYSAAGWQEKSEDSATNAGFWEEKAYFGRFSLANCVGTACDTPSPNSLNFFAVFGLKNGDFQTQKR